MKDGIYEQIINEKVQNELSGLSLSEYAIDTEKLDLEEARMLLTTYISDVTRRALTFIRDELRMSDGEKLLKQIHTCNEVIKLLSERLGDDELYSMRIEEQGEILTSVYKKKIQFVQSVVIKRQALFPH